MTRPDGSPSTGAPTLLSLDIDGTLETGDPPGPVTMDVVRMAKARGLVVGSASDRTVGFQRGMWEAARRPGARWHERLYAVQRR